MAHNNSRIYYMTAILTELTKPENLNKYVLAEDLAKKIVVKKFNKTGDKVAHSHPIWKILTEMYEFGFVSRKPIYGSTKMGRHKYAYTTTYDGAVYGDCNQIKNSMELIFSPFTPCSHTLKPIIIPYLNIF